VLSQARCKNGEGHQGLPRFAFWLSATDRVLVGVSAGFLVPIAAAGLYAMHIILVGDYHSATLGCRAQRPPGCGVCRFSVARNRVGVVGRQAADPFRVASTVAPGNCHLRGSGDRRGLFCAALGAAVHRLEPRCGALHARAGVYFADFLRFIAREAGSSGLAWRSFCASGNPDRGTARSAGCTGVSRAHGRKCRQRRKRGVGARHVVPVLAFLRGARGHLAVSGRRCNFVCRRLRT
jgi:hypothetical protein